jgi:hypothetical protein
LTPSAALGLDDANRGFNLRIHALAAAFSDGLPIGYVCECGEQRCLSVVTLQASDFDDVVAHKGWLIVEASHDDVGEVIHELPGCLVVEQLAPATD